MANRFPNGAALPLATYSAATGTHPCLEYEISTARPFQWITAVLKVSAKTGTTPTLDVKIQISTDTKTWTDLTGGAFTQVTGATGLPSTETLYLTVSSGRYMRLYYAIGGTAGPSWDFIADFTLNI